MIDGKDDRLSYTGGPDSFPDQVWGLLRPRGGATADGLRLAVVNGVGIFVTLILLAIASLFNRLVNLVIHIPYTLVMIALIAVLAICGAYIWYRYSLLWVSATRAHGRALKPDMFGVVAGLPFIVIGLFLLATAVLQLLFAIISFSGGRLVDALQQTGVAAFFFVLAAGCVVVARYASNQEK